MIELLLDAIVSLGSTEVQNVLTSVGESAVKKFRESQAWKKLIVGTGEFLSSFYYFSFYLFTSIFGKLFKLTISNVCNCCTANCLNNSIRSF